MTDWHIVQPRQKATALPEGLTLRKGSDKRNQFPKPKGKPLVYAPISQVRVDDGLSFRDMPINARQPNWSTGGATAREERVATTYRGPIGDNWRGVKSGCVLDEAAHAKALQSLTVQGKAVARVRREYLGKIEAQATVKAKPKRAVRKREPKPYVTQKPHDRRNMGGELSIERWWWDRK